MRRVTTSLLASCLVLVASLSDVQAQAWKVKAGDKPAAKSADKAAAPPGNSDAKPKAAKAAKQTKKPKAKPAAASVSAKTKTKRGNSKRAVDAADDTDDADADAAATDGAKTQLARTSRAASDTARMPELDEVTMIYRPAED